MPNEKKQLLEMEGSVENIVYHNDSNQYTVMELSSGDALVTVVGTFPYISVGEKLHLYGTWTAHATFGEQFKSEAFERSRPETTSAMLKYLSSGAVKGIGAATAGKIIAAFGDDAIDVIENDPERLATIKGITLKKAGCADVQMNWNKVASRISELIRMNRYFTPDEQALYDKAQAQDVVRNTAHDSYNAIKEAHPDNIVLFQVGDFFEMYGEDAKQAVELLDMNLTTRNIPGAGRVEMCGLPSNNLEMYVEKLRDKYDVTIAEASDFRGERHIYTLRSIDHEAEASIDVQETEFGADGSNVFHDPAADVTQPTVRELFDGYKLTVGNALSKDTAFVNACRNSDRQNAYLEGADAIRRIVMASDDLQLVRLYFDMPAFHNRLHQELLEELYPTLAATVAPSPYQITQEDIDNALLDWHDNLKGKQEVALYMQAHGRERSTAAWLAAKYGWEDSKTPMYIHVGNAEPVTLTWAQVQRRLAQLIRENKFYDENFHLTDTPFVCIPARAELPAFGMRCWNGSAEMGNKCSALQNRITPLLTWMASNGIWELSYPLRRLQHRLAIPIILEIAFHP